MGVEASIETDPKRIRPDTSEVFRLCCDSSLLVELTGYRHRYELDEGLDLTIDWFRDPQNLSRYKSEIYNL